MCRIALLPSGYKGEKIVDFLDDLEKSKGGDGNGFGWFNKRNEAQVIKGLKVKNKTINTIKPASDMVLYHTRIASAGETNDENTQPFITKADGGDPFILCHNGTWTTYAEYKKILLMMGKLKVKHYKEWSDTRFMAHLIATQGEDRLDLPTSGVWVKFYGNKAIVHVKDGGDWCAYKIGKKWMYASEFPEDEYKKIWKFKSNSLVLCTPDEGFKILEGDGADYEDNTSSYSRTYRSYGKGARGGIKTTYYGKDGKKYELTDDESWSHFND